MLVTLEELKRSLGLDVDDDSDDANLTDIVERATEWVEGQTKRRFSTPESTTEILRGSGRRDLYLMGHVAGLNSEEEHGEVVVEERFLYGDWEVMDELLDFERRGDKLVRIDGSVWSREAEYKVTYDNGYTAAPADIKALVLELAAGEYGANASAADGTADITGEKIGDYSYTVGSSQVAGAIGSGVVSGTGQATLNRWMRRLA